MRQDVAYVRQDDVRRLGDNGRQLEFVMGWKLNLR
jgi:hypothetical protein